MRIRGNIGSDEDDLRKEREVGGIGDGGVREAGENKGQRLEKLECLRRGLIKGGRNRNNLQMKSNPH